MALEFQINLGGNFIGALEKSAKGLGEHEKQTKDAAKALEVFEGEFGKVQAGALALNFNAFQEGGNFLKFDLAEGAALALESIRKVADAVYDLGAEIVKAAADSQDLNLAIKLDVGEEGAEKVDKIAMSFEGSAFSPKQIKEALLPILEESGNTHQDQWNDLTTAATDVATRRHTGVAGVKTALRALNDIELNPQRLRGSLKELGIKEVDYYQDLGALLGITAKSAEAQTKAGKLKSQTLLSVALNQIAERSGGALGNATNEGSKTLGATLARINTLKDTLFERIADGKGVKAIQRVLDGFVELMKGPLGDRLLANVDKGLESVAGWIGKITSPEGVSAITRGFESAVDVIKKIPAVVDEIVVGFKFFAANWAFNAITGINAIGLAMPLLSGAAETLAVSLGPLVIAVGALGYAFIQIRDTLKELGGLSRVADDFKAWIGGEKPAITKGAVEDPADRARRVMPDFVQDLIPKYAMGEAGPAEMIVPQYASGGIVDRPTLALVGEAGPEIIIPLGRKSGGTPMPEMPSLASSSVASSITYAPQYHVSGAGHGVQEQLEAFDQQARISFKKLLDEANAAIGAVA